MMKKKKHNFEPDAEKVSALTLGIADEITYEHIKYQDNGEGYSRLKASDFLTSHNLKYDKITLE